MGRHRYVLQNLWFVECESDKTFSERLNRALQSLKYNDYDKMRQLLAAEGIFSGNEMEVSAHIRLTGLRVKNYLKIPFTVVDNRNFISRLLNIKPYLCCNPDDGLKM